MQLVDTLINKQDTFEIVRDQIAGILVAESVSQQALALAEGEDPDQWKFDVYLERSRPWDILFDSKGDVLSDTPLVNVWFDSTSYDMGSSNVLDRQTSQTVYNIDCYGSGVSSKNKAGGHYSGDRVANFEVQRIFRLVRNIIMSNNNTYLQLRTQDNKNLVGMRFPQSVSAFQPQQGDQFIPYLMGLRFALSVQFNEFSPQNTPEILESVFATVKRQEDSKVILEMNIDTTP